jgi:tRNA pseudouridine synthase 10
MVHIFHYSLEKPLPALSGDWLRVVDTHAFSTYAIGLRTEKIEGKKPLLAAIRAAVSESPAFSGKTFVLQHPDVEIVFDEIIRQVSIHIFPLIITGRYTKLSRTIAQTRHFCFECKGSGKKFGNVCPQCKGEKVLTKESVQELIAPFFQKEFSCAEVLFHGAGREDVDVRMLGRGRPFALTLENPRTRSTDIEKLRVHINHALKGKVELFELKIGHSQDVERVTRTYHTKRYRALVESPEKININSLTPFLEQKMDVIQMTPQRVEKRRAMKERPHWIILESVKRISDHTIEVTLHSSAGCYIKEFISGDNGRSKPSLKDWLNVSCVCKELDVLEIVDETMENTIS